MISLSLKDGGHLGTIDESELALLQAQCEEENSRDQDYYIDATMIRTLLEAGAGANLVHLLQSALGSAEGVDIAWQRS